MGYEQVQLILREGTGGDFWYMPEKGSLPRMKIGADYNTWREVVACLIHETQEMLLDRNNLRFNPTHTISPRDHAAYIFIMTHPQFHDVCAKTADFIAVCLPDLKRAWGKWRKKK